MALANPNDDSPAMGLERLAGLPMRRGIRDAAGLAEYDATRERCRAMASNIQKAYLRRGSKLPTRFFCCRSPLSRER